MKVKIKALNSPLIWLDTFVILYLKKIQNNESLDPRSSKNDEYIKNNVKRLFDVIRKKKNEKKLVCPEGEQDVEIFFRYDKSHIRRCHDVMDQLSSGVQFLPWSEIRISQMEKAIKAYLLKKDFIILDTNDIVNITRIDNNFGFRVRVNAIPSNNTISKWKLDKEIGNEKLENLRLKTLKSNITFQRQLEIEYNSTLHLLTHDYPSIMDRIFNGIEDLNDFDILREICKPLHLWNRIHKIKNSPQKINEFLSFLKSDYYKEIPHEYISSNIFAKIITGKKKVQKGDSYDVGNLSSVLPYCDYVLTDGTMKKLIQSMEIDKKYDTEIYSFQDINLLCNKLEEL